MSDEIVPGRAAPSQEGRARAAAPAPRNPPDIVFVELGEAVQKAQIARDGVPVAKINLDQVVIDQVAISKPPFITKVVSQSIAPGTPVPKGTAVDIVLVEPFDLPSAIAKDGHRGLDDRTIGQVAELFLRNDAAVRGVVARNEAADTLSADDQAVLRGAFERAKVPISDTPGQTVGDAFRSLQTAFTLAL
jgi:hypothetical protein